MAAEPARSKSPYDEEAAGQAVSRPRLKALEGGGQGGEAPGGRPDLKSVPRDKNPESVEASSAGRPHLTALPGGQNPEEADTSKAEANDEDKQNNDDDFEFNPKDKSQRGNIRHVFRAASRHRKPLLIGGTLLGGGFASVVVIFMMLIPLKIEHIVTNLENRFGSSSESAIDRESENMLSRYIKTRVLPALTHCSGSTIDKNCNPHFGNVDNPVEALYKGWSDARLENKLATKYGIEFHAVRSGSQWTYYMKAPGIKNPHGDNITSFINDDGDLFQQVSRGQARAYVHTAFGKETFLKQVRLRLQYGPLMEEKYGIKRCIIFCGTRDTIQEWKDKKINVPRMFIAQRVLTPHTETMGIIMQCLFDPACDPTKTAPQTSTPGEDGALNGAPENPEVDTASRQKFKELLSTYNITSAADIDKMASDYKTLSEKGLRAFLIEKALEKIGLSAISDKVTSALPVVGWLTKASDFLTRLSTLGLTIKKLSFTAAASGGAVQLFNMYQTYADEIHTGNVDASQVGQMVQSLGPGNQGDGNDPEVGGTASAEQTPLYQHIMSGSGAAAPTVSLLNGILPASASAASKSTGSTYVCGNHKPVPFGKLVCAEEEFGKGNRTANSISSFTHKGFIAPITSGAGFISSAAGKLAQALPFSGFLGKLISHAPGISSLSELVSKAVSPFFQGIVSDIIPDPFSTNMSGGRKFDLMAAGADVSNNDFAHIGLGGKKLSSRRVAEILNQQQDEQRQQFEKMPLFARMFSTDTQYSLVSRVAMAVPLGLQSSAGNSFASLISSPFSSLINGFGSIFSGRVSAAATPEDDPFGVTQYGYDPSEIPKDPENYWNQHCSDNAGQAYQNDAEYKAHSWNQDAADHPSSENGMPENDTVNPCLLIKSSVGAAGGVFDTSLLTPDDQKDLANLNNQYSSNASPATTTPPPSGNSQQLAQQIINNSKIDLTCFNSSVKQDVQDAAAGKPGTAGTPISSAILKLIVVIGQSHSVCITAIESNGQGHTPGSYHYSGDAVDFGSLDGATITGRNPPAIAIINQAVSVLPNGTSIGQLTCPGATPFIPPSWAAFIDTCTHLHIQVPRGTP